MSNPREQDLLSLIISKTLGGLVGMKMDKIFSDIKFNMGDTLRQKIIEKSFVIYLNNKQQQYKKSILWYHDNFSPIISKEEQALLPLAKLIWVDENDNIRDEHNASLKANFPQACQQAFKHVKMQSKEVGELLEEMWKQSNLEKKLKERNALSDQDTDSRAKLDRDIVESNRNFEAVIKGYFRILYTHQEPQRSWYFKQMVVGVKLLKDVFRKDAVLQERAIEMFCKEIPTLDQNIESKALGSKTAFSKILPLVSATVNNPEIFKWINSQAEFCQKLFTPSICEKLVRVLVNLQDANISQVEIGNYVQMVFKGTQQLKSSGCSESEIAQHLNEWIFAASTLDSQDFMKKIPSPDQDFKIADLEKTFQVSNKLAELFQIPKDEQEAFKKFVMTWKNPELLIKFHHQWKEDYRILTLLEDWVLAASKGTEALTSLRFSEGANGEYFKNFDKDFLTEFQKEINFDQQIQELGKLWRESHGFSLKETTQALQTLQEKLGNILKLDPTVLASMKLDEVLAKKIQVQPLDLEALKELPKTFWTDYKKRVDSTYKEQSKQQNTHAKTLMLKSFLPLSSTETTYSDKLQAYHDLTNTLEKYGKIWRENEKLIEEKDRPEIQNALKIIFNNIALEENPFEKVTIRYTSDPEILFTTSDEALGSCQSITKKLEYNSALMGRVTNGKQKLMVMYNKENGRPIGIMTTKADKDKDDGKVVILREPSYQCVGCPLSSGMVAEMMTLATLLECKRLKVPCVTSKEDSMIKKSTCFEKEDYPNSLMSHTGLAQGLEYEDTGRMGLKDNVSSFEISSDILMKLSLKK